MGSGLDLQGERGQQREADDHAGAHDGQRARLLARGARRAGGGQVGGRRRRGGGAGPESERRAPGAAPPVRPRKAASYGSKSALERRVDVSENDKATIPRLP